jgi:enamine deaminase RidA (YjgF/YER057c/UK114 family)
MASRVVLAKGSPAADRTPGSRSPDRDGVDCVVTKEARGTEVCLTVRPLPGEAMADLFGRLARALEELDAAIVQMTVFGLVRAHHAAEDAMRRSLGGMDWPATWVEGSACTGAPIAGLQVFAFAGGDVQRIRLDGRIVGSMFEDGAARHCWLGGLNAPEGGASRSEHTRRTLAQAAAALDQAGFSLADVVRTWFFLDDIHRWYSRFNEARTQFYSGIEFNSGSFPASTGIGGRNPAGTALVAGAWAIRPLSPATRVREVGSPLQCPAPVYGSAFSRAMELASPGGHRLFVSGTASIAPDGRTLWRGDARKQVAQTMLVLEGILESRGFTFSDLTRATAYFKHGADAAVLEEWRSARGLPRLPQLAAQCRICRADLLFEIEADAWQGGPAGGL